MRNWIIGAAALLAVAVPGVAAAQATGYVGLDYGNVDVDHGGSDDGWGASGAVAFQGSSSISFEVDAGVFDSDNSDTTSSLAGHAYTRNDDYLFGGFVGYHHADDVDAWSAGLEANKYFDNWTLAGSLVYENSDDVNTSAWGANVEGRIFATDNFRVDLDAGWASVDFGGPGGNDNVWNAGIGGEYQFASMPVSIAAHYNHFDDNDSDISGDAVLVSLRYNWGGSLKDRDRSGASQASLTGIGALTGIF